MNWQQIIAFKEPVCLLLQMASVSRIRRPQNRLDYIIGRYNPSVMSMDLVSYATYLVCVSLIHEWHYPEFKVNSEQQTCAFSDNFYLLLEFLPEIC